MPKFTTVDDYMAALSASVRERMADAMMAVRRALPDSAEVAISYDMPTFKVAGRSVLGLAVWKHHLAIYPAPSGDADLDRELEPFRAERSTLQFKHKDPLPTDLLTRVAAALLMRARG